MDYPLIKPGFDVEIMMNIKVETPKRMPQVVYSRGSFVKKVV